VLSDAREVLLAEPHTMRHADGSASASVEDLPLQITGLRDVPNVPPWAEARPYLAISSVLAGEK
jgi:hypothetical protein